MRLLTRGVWMFVRSLRENWIPALGIWLLGATLAFGYYHFKWAKDCGSEIENLRAESGIWYPIVATAIFGALLPTITQFIIMKDQRKNALLRLPWLALYWGYRGVESDYLYRFQAWLWGPEASLLAVAGKVSLDMFIYNPIVTPEAMYLRWVSRRLGEFPAETRIFPKGWYKNIIVPLLVVTWALWIPAATFMYMLPTQLQLPMENMILWLWSLMLIFVTKQKD